MKNILSGTKVFLAALLISLTAYFAEGRERKLEYKCKHGKVPFKLTFTHHKDEDVILLSRPNGSTVTLISSEDGISRFPANPGPKSLCPESIPVYSIDDHRILFFTTLDDGKPQDDSLWLILFDLQKMKQLDIVSAGATLGPTYQVEQIDNRHFKVQIIHHWPDKTNTDEDPIKAWRQIAILENKINVSW